MRSGEKKVQSCESKEVQERNVGYNWEGKGSPSCTARRKGCPGLGVLLVPWRQVRLERLGLCYGSGSHGEARGLNPFMGSTRSRLFP